MFATFDEINTVDVLQAAVLRRKASDAVMAAGDRNSIASDVYAEIGLNERKSSLSNTECCLSKCLDRAMFFECFISILLTLCAISLDQLFLFLMKYFTEFYVCVSSVYEIRYTFVSRGFYTCT